jgi:hypothetical protein
MESKLPDLLVAIRRRRKRWKISQNKEIYLWKSTKIIPFKNSWRKLTTVLKDRKMWTDSIKVLSQCTPTLRLRAIDNLWAR